MKTLGWLITITTASVSLAASFYLFFLPKSDCAANVKRLQECAAGSRITVANLLALSRGHDRVPLEQMLPWLKCEVPQCPDGGEYYFVVTEREKQIGRRTESRFHVNCTIHQFHSW